jgi:hypothetical protein
MENFGGQGFADVAAKFLPTSIFPEEKEAMRASSQLFSSTSACCAELRRCTKLID